MESVFANSVLVLQHFNMLSFVSETSFEGMKVATAESLSQSMNSVVKHYASLFRLPSYEKVILLQALICVGCWTCSTLILFHTIERVLLGFSLGWLLFVIGFFFDYLSNILFLRNDPIYDLRRTSTVSLFSLGLWFLFILFGSAIGSLFGLSWWIRLVLLGFSGVLILRLIVFQSSSSTSLDRTVMVSFLQPFSCLLPFLLFWIQMGYNISFSMCFFLTLSPIISFFSVRSFLFLLNRVGEQTLKIPALSLFKAFLLNWVVGLNAPFEEFLERLGEEQDVNVSLLKFDANKPKVVIVVPSVHPGPFKNVGSSLLPSLLKIALEERLSYVTCVMLGMQGHELDLASQFQNQKVINHVVKSMDFETRESTATPSVKVSHDLVTVCCQIFGKTAFLSFTLAPNTTEDLPQELGLFVRQESEKHGLACCVAVNAHNSINNTLQMPVALETLKAAAAACLKRATLLKRLPFQVGASTIIPQEFSLEDGMGAGGITVTTVKVGEQKTAYVVIDGNNMVSGLREKILSVLQSLSIDEGEIFTTDTHSVSAVILGKRGYHPIGEVMDNEKLIDYIKEAALKALSSLEPAKAACNNIVIPNVKVIGEKRLFALSLLIERSLQRARRAVIPLFGSIGLVLMLFLLLV